MVVVNNTTAGKIIPTIVKNLYRIQQVFRTEPVFHLYKVIYAFFYNNCPKSFHISKLYIIFAPFKQIKRWNCNPNMLRSKNQKINS